MEMKHRILDETVRTMISEVNLSQYLWVNAIYKICHILIKILIIPAWKR